MVEGYFSVAWLMIGDVWWRLMIHDWLIVWCYYRILPSPAYYLNLNIPFEYTWMNHLNIFPGVTGRVKMDAIGNRVPILVVRNFESVNSVKTIARYNQIRESYTTLSRDFIFADNSKTKPPDRSTCGFMTDPCPGMTFHNPYLHC